MSKPTIEWVIEVLLSPGEYAPSEELEAKEYAIRILRAVREAREGHGDYDAKTKMRICDGCEEEGK